jgi:hypothetical protein
MFDVALVPLVNRRGIDLHMEHHPGHFFTES